jgi:hypothetical protein
VKKKGRKPSRRARAGPKSHPLTGQPTPKQEAELTEAFRKALLRPGRPRQKLRVWIPELPAPRVPADEPAANLLSPLEWLCAEVARRKEAGDIPTGRGAATLFAKQLEKQMAVDVKARKCSAAMSWRSIRSLLYQTKLWPLE